MFADPFEQHLDAALGTPQQRNCFIISHAVIFLLKIVEDVVFKVSDVNVSGAPTARATAVDRDMGAGQDRPLAQDPPRIERLTIAASSFARPICHGTDDVISVAHLDTCLSEARSHGKPLLKRRPI